MPINTQLINKGLQFLDHQILKGLLQLNLCSFEFQFIIFGSGKGLKINGKKNTTFLLNFSPTKVINTRAQPSPKPQLPRYTKFFSKGRLREQLTFQKGKQATSNSGLHSPAFYVQPLRNLPTLSVSLFLPSRTKRICPSSRSWKQTLITVTVPTSLSLPFPISAILFIQDVFLQGTGVQGLRKWYSTPKEVARQYQWLILITNGCIII